MPKDTNKKPSTPNKTSRTQIKTSSTPNKTPSTQVHNLSQIYALFSVLFTGLDNAVAYQKWQIAGMSANSFVSAGLIIFTVQHLKSADRVQDKDVKWKHLCAAGCICTWSDLVLLCGRWSALGLTLIVDLHICTWWPSQFRWPATSSICRSRV